MKTKTTLLMCLFFLFTLNNLAQDLIMLQDSILYYAKKGNTNKVKKFIEIGVDVNSRYDFDWTPLHFAANSGRIEMVKLLLEKNAGVNLQNSSGETALMLAANLNQFTACKLLLDNKANKNTENSNGQKAIDLAKEREYDIVAGFLKKTNKVTKKYAALIAADLGDWEEVKKLIP